MYISFHLGQLGRASKEQNGGQSGGGNSRQPEEGSQQHKEGSASVFGVSGLLLCTPSSSLEL